eukprot:765070-Hanusia_phi.AAC.3
MIYLCFKELSKQSKALSRKLAETLSRSGMFKTPTVTRKPENLEESQSKDFEPSGMEGIVSQVQTHILRGDTGTGTLNGNQTLQVNEEHALETIMTLGVLENEIDRVHVGRFEEADCDFRSSSAVVSQRIETSLRKDLSESDSMEEEEKPSVSRPLAARLPARDKLKDYRKKQSVMRIFQRGSDDSGDEAQDQAHDSKSLVLSACQNRLEKAWDVKRKVKTWHPHK